MNKIEQLNLVRKAHIRMLKVFEPYQGKNLNRYRYKNIKGLVEWKQLEEENPTPFEINGLLGGLCIRDWSNVDVAPLKVRIKELENVIHELDLFDNGDADVFKELHLKIRELSNKKREIQAKYSHIPSYFLTDFIETM